MDWASKDPHNNDPGYLAFCRKILPPEDYEQARRYPQMYVMYQDYREAIKPRVKQPVTRNDPHGFYCEWNA